MKTPDQFSPHESSRESGQSYPPHPRFDSVVVDKNVEEKEELLAFDQFVEETVQAELERLPFVEALEPALREEDAAGADFFVKLVGVENILAVDVTVSTSPQQMEKKLSRIGEIYRAKIERDGALITSSDETVPIKTVVMLLDKKDFVSLYNRYAKASFKYDWQADGNTQRAIVLALIKSMQDFFDKVGVSNPAAARRQSNQVLELWSKMSRG